MLPFSFAPPIKVFKVARHVDNGEIASFYFAVFMIGARIRSHLPLKILL